MVIRKIPQTGVRPPTSKPPPPTNHRNVSSAKLVLTSPAPADRSRLSLPVNKVNLNTDPNKVNVQPDRSDPTEPDDEACRQAADDLKRALDVAIQTFNKVSKERRPSAMLKESLTCAQSTLNDTLGSTGPSANIDRVVLDTANQLSDRLLDIIKSKIDQALQ